MSSFILSSLLPLELGGDKVPWTHPLVPCLFGAAAIFLTLFVLVETRWAKEPILEPALFTQRDAVISFLIMGLQSAAQFGVRLASFSSIIRKNPIAYIDHVAKSVHPR